MVGIFAEFAVPLVKGIVKYGSWVKVGDNECSNDYFVKKTNTFSKWDEDNNWYGGGYYSKNYGTWINGKKVETKKETKKDSSETKNKQAVQTQLKNSLSLYKGNKPSRINDEVDSFLKTKEDYKYYQMCVKDFYVTDDEILDHLIDGFKMTDVYSLFEDIYGSKSRWMQGGDDYTPAWERYNA